MRGHDPRIEQHPCRHEEQHGKGIAQGQHIFGGALAELGFIEFQPRETGVAGGGAEAGVQVVAEDRSGIDQVGALVSPLGYTVLGVEVERWTLAVGAVTAAVIGVTAAIPDSMGSTRSSPPPTTRMIAAAPGVGVPFSPALLSHLDSLHASRIKTAGGTTGAGSTPRVIPPAAAPTTGAHHPNHGCDSNPTSAAPPVPVGRHAYGSPVTHPSAGGCQA